LAGVLKDVEPFALSWRGAAAFVLELYEQDAFVTVRQDQVGETGVAGVWG
jgi:hypothetical protein